jgi:hypothetical protein
MAVLLIAGTAAAQRVQSQSAPIDLAVTYDALHTNQITAQNFWMQGGAVDLGARIYRGSDVRLNHRFAVRAFPPAICALSSPIPPTTSRTPSALAPVWLYALVDETVAAICLESAPGDLSFELREREQDIKGESTHGRGYAEPLGDGHEADILAIERMNANVALLYSSRSVPILGRKQKDPPPQNALPPITSRTLPV